MNTIPDFSTVELGDSPAPNDLDAWVAAKERAAVHSKKVLDQSSLHDSQTRNMAPF